MFVKDAVHKAMCECICVYPRDTPTEEEHSSNFSSVFFPLPSFMYSLVITCSPYRKSDEGALNSLKDRIL